MLRFWMVAGLVVLAGCASENTPAEDGAAQSDDGMEDSIVGRFFAGTFSGAMSAVVSPFEDIGLVKAPISEKLEKIAENPYTMPKSLRCDKLRKEIAELDELVGPDDSMPVGVLDNIDEKSTREYVDKGADIAKNRAVDTVRSHVDIIPYRSVVRAVSGADKHSRMAAYSLQSGKLRRAFLKGLASTQSAKCLIAPAKNVTVAKKDKPTEIASK